MPNIQPPVSMGAFRSATLERVWILPFALTFDRAVLEPADLNYDLDIDTSANFASPNAMHLTKTSVGLVGFQEGDGVAKAFEVILPGRGLSDDLVWYWRVRVNDGKFVSAWSDTRQLTVPARQDLAQASTLYAALADENSYSKEALSANSYKLLLQVGRELDLLLDENDQSVSDLFLDSARDSALAANFAAYLGLERASSDVAATHRWKTKRLWKAFVNYPGTLQGMIDVVTAFVGEPPSILDLTATQGWILDQNFIKAPSHPEIAPVIVIYSRPQRGYSFSLTVFNSWGLTYDSSVLERFIRRMKPAHTQMTLSYATARHWSLRYDRQADWALWTNSGNMDISSYPGTLRLSGSTTTGTLTSPVERVVGASAYDTPLISTTPSGQTVTVSYRTSQDGFSFTPYVALQHGVDPDSSVAIGPYVQFKVDLSRTSGSAPNPVLGSLEFRGVR